MGFQKVSSSDIKSLKRSMHCLINAVNNINGVGGSDNSLQVTPIQVQEVGNPSNTFIVSYVYDPVTNTSTYNDENGNELTFGVDFEIMTSGSITDRTTSEEFVNLAPGTTQVTLSNDVDVILGAFRNGVEQKTTDYTFTAPNVIDFISNPIGSLNGGLPETYKIIYNKV